MATKNEKKISSLLGVVLGGLIGYLIADNEDVKLKDRWQYVLFGAAFGGLSGLVLAEIFGSKNNTVNYKLYNGRKKVYHGITYDHRINNRKIEHINSGKVFTRMVVDTPKTRVEAIELERYCIQRDKPTYNIRHNQN